MTYERLAYVYDYLMSDVPYSNWLDFLRKKKNEYSIKGNRILDLACGTGELSILLAQNNFDVTGVDLSEDMLMVAREKAEGAGVNISLYEQDMIYLDGLGSYDIVAIFCDSLNYLASFEDVEKTFLNVKNHLKSNGLFLFDVHSLYKVEQVFGSETFGLTEGKVSYIWDCFQGEHPYSVEHEMTFFVLDETTGQYERFDELHIQRTYPIAKYQSVLEACGFSVLSITADFTNEMPNEKSERIFFTCRLK